MRRVRPLAKLALVIVAGLGVVASAAERFSTGQEVDSGYHPTVGRPAYDGEQHPAVLVDEAHREAYTATGRYRPFAELLAKDGYRVKPNRSPFQPASLDAASVLVIADPLGAGTPSHPAFTPAECDAVYDWVQKGGALLLIAGPAPAGQAAAILARRLGVDMSQGETFDPEHSGAAGTPTAWITFSRQNHLLGDHPILSGREAAERIATVVTFHGQALKGPEGSAAFLPLGDAARDQHAEEGVDLSAAGRAQGIAFELGKGRVVVLADPAMATAQQVAGGALKVGMNRPGNDDRQLVLNVLHWLTRLLN
ncbi:MAG TPA: DUF4350 domain-containing protein [Thermoanaerobaculia bacterium]|jgi:hypothetical protein|nr:DUF4350 domain-containing protein [Thermoanaerobaculia bacterium]